MILTCPNCSTQYVVKDGAIPPGGRQVRCASCKHSWHQYPEGTLESQGEPAVGAAPVEESEQVPETEAAEEAVSAADVAEPDESIAEATLIEPRSGPEAEERAYEEAALDADTAPVADAEDEIPPMGSSVAPAETYDREPAAQEDWAQPPQAEPQVDDFTPYPAPEAEAPRRRSPLLTILLIVIVVVALAAAFWFLAPPDLKARLGLVGMSTTPLALVTTHMDRQRLESGNELLTVTGRVINPTSKNQPVPPLQAQLKTKSGKVVYSWTIAPPAPSLAPGESKSFNSAEVSVPPGGEELTLTLGGAAT